MATAAPKKKPMTKAVPARKPAPEPMRRPPTTDERSLPLKGKKVANGKTPPPPPPVSTDPITTEVPQVPAPVAESNGAERLLCWIELVKNGNVFVARSNAVGGPSKEYKNRVLEDMLTELIIELQEEIQE